MTMEMQEPFDVEFGDIVYSVFPDEKDTYTIFKDGKEVDRLVGLRQKDQIIDAIKNV